MDTAQIDIYGNPLLFCGKGSILKNERVQNDIFLLEVEFTLEREQQFSPEPGQFYMIQSVNSSVQFGRPISVFRSERKGLTQRVYFMILKKGCGTAELTSLKAGDSLKLLGPLGNTWPVVKNFGKICICGGGIGIAPVANLASTLPSKSYDLFVAFKSGCYGIENLSPSELTITTDDGSVGIQGMLSAAFDANIVRQKGYKVIYACGPLPMLAFVQKVAREVSVKCYLSLERRMLCAVGACLGCTIKTKNGNKRVCKDGPIFDAEIVEFPSFVAKIPHDSKFADSVKWRPDLSVTIAGVKFRNPVIAASGTFGFGQNYRGFFNVNILGGICSKGLTLEPKDGNEGERVIETPAGDINSIGLENPGIPHFIEHELSEMLKLEPVTIANLAGDDLASYVKGAKLLNSTAVPMIELNISCPNVKDGGMTWGISEEAASKCVSAVRKVTDKPLIVKLSPNAPDIVGVALACIEAGADALSLINTIQAVVIDIEKGRPVFKNVKAGLCGPAIKPISLRMVWDVCEAVNSLPKDSRVPVIGLGGISRWQDAVEFIMAGASAVQVGTATFSNPKAMEEIITGLEEFMASHGYHSIREMRGIARLSLTC